MNAFTFIGILVACLVGEAAVFFLSGLFTTGVSDDDWLWPAICTIMVNGFLWALFIMKYIYVGK